MNFTDKAVIPDAARHEMTRRRSGIGEPHVGSGPVSAQRRFTPQRARDDVKRMLAGLAALALAACGGPQTSDRTYDRDPSLPAALPFSSAVIVGDTIYLSGEIGRAPGTTEVVEGVGAQTRQIFENYRATLARVGASLDDIVKCTVFLGDMADYAEMNAAYAAFFPGEKPARSTVGVDGLAMGAALEIECLAVRRGGKR